MSIPSSTELTILKVLWSQKRLSAREVHQLTEVQLSWSLSSTRTTLQRMIDKNLVGTEKVHGITVYLPMQSKPRVMAALMQDFMSRVLEIKGPLPTSALGQSALFTEKEWDELTAILEADTDE